MPAFSRTLRSDGIHLQNETYDSPALDQIRTHSGKVEVRQDPYDTDRAWVRHPQNDVWIDCTARSVRLSRSHLGQRSPSGSLQLRRPTIHMPNGRRHSLDSETRRVKAERSPSGTPRRRTATGGNSPQRRPSPRAGSGPKLRLRKRTAGVTNSPPAAVEPAPWPQSRQSEITQTTTRSFEE